MGNVRCRLWEMAVLRAAPAAQGTLGGVGWGVSWGPLGAIPVETGALLACVAAAWASLAARNAAAYISTCEMGALPAQIPRAVWVNGALICPFGLAQFPGALLRPLHRGA